MKQSFFNNVIYGAVREGKSSRQFRMAAQGWDDIFWYLLVLVSVVWFFASWKWALIPDVYALFTLIQRINSTRLANALDRIGR
jgi:hypothetical protein